MNSHDTAIQYRHANTFLVATLVHGNRFTCVRRYRYNRQQRECATAHRIDRIVQEQLDVLASGPEDMLMRLHPLMPAPLSGCKLMRQAIEQHGGAE